jgi:hypothetical protein
MSKALLSVIGFVVLALAPLNANAGELCGGSHNNVREAMDAVSTMVGIKQIRNDRDYLELKDEKSGIVWAFTKAQHFAHPAVFCRRVIQEGGRFHLEVKTLCGAAKDVCDRFAAALAAESKRVANPK